MSASRGHIGDLLRRYRRSQDIGLREFAKEFDFSLATMQRIENGKPMSQENMLRVLWWLFGERVAYIRKEQK